jgi:predicted site-specific integrase-resolvase
MSRHHLLTAEDAATLADVNPATLRDWTRRGLLTRYGSARRALYDWRELDQAKTTPKPRRRVAVDDVA